MPGPFEMPAGYDAWKTRSPYDDHTFECTRCDDQGCDRCCDDHTFECTRCDDQGCDRCCETEEARDLEDLEERCGDYTLDEPIDPMRGVEFPFAENH